MCIDGTKAVVGETVGTLTQVKALALDCTSSHCSLRHYVVTVKKKNPVSLKNVFDEAITIISSNLDLL